MKIKLLSTALALALFCFSCKKNAEVIEDAEATSIDNIKVSDSFNWNSTNEITFSIGLSDARFANLVHVVYIYDIDPQKGGKLLGKGSATLVTPFNTKLTLTRALKSVYILKSAPDGTKVGQDVSVGTKNINLSFGLGGVSQTNAIAAVKVENTAASTTAIPNCAKTVTDVTSITTTSSSDVVCFNGTKNSQLTIEANFGGTVKINAPNKTVTIQGFNHTNLNVVILSNTTVVFPSNTEIKNGETWTNFGTFKNSGKVDVNGLLENNGTADFENLQINSNGKINNYCKLYANDAIFDNVVNNYNYVLVKKSTKVNSNGKVNLIGGTSGAYFETKDLLKGSNNVYFHGTNAVGLVKVTGTIQSDLIRESKQANYSYFSGLVKLCTSANDIPTQFFQAPAALGCDSYIKTDDCMPVSNGTAPVVLKDTDKDGVIDADDDYPEDANKAHKTYSVNYTEGGSTLAFEDNWPVKGDYDLNDVVLLYRYLIATNAANKVVEVNAKYSLIATGADYINGAGIQFPLVAGSAKLTVAPAGVYLEAKQDSVVLILFDDSRKIQPTGNTVIGKTTSPAVNFDITFEVTDGPDIKNFGAVVFNPFIWNGTNGFGRGYETHLFGKNPTNLANTSLFDTKDDASRQNAKFYSTKEKLPWVIEVPIANFSYPIEGARVDKAYTNFHSWATSSGSSSEEWYKKLSGSNSSLIYPIK